MATLGLLLARLQSYVRYVVVRAFDGYVFSHALENDQEWRGRRRTSLRLCQAEPPICASAALSANSLRLGLAQLHRQIESIEVHVSGETPLLSQETYTMDHIDLLI